MYKQRIIREANEASKMNDPRILLKMNSNSINSWKAFIWGPIDSPFNEGIFELAISLDKDYPMIAPKVFFKTRIFHPNIHFETGEICLEVVKDEWSPMWTLESLCRAIQVLMLEPNSLSPLNCDAGNLIRSGDIECYKKLARTYTQEYAILVKDFDSHLASSNN